MKSEIKKSVGYKRYLWKNLNGDGEYRVGVYYEGSSPCIIPFVRDIDTEWQYEAFEE